MNIDLLISQRGEAGLVADGSFSGQPVGILYDQETHTITLELSDMDTLHTNIPVEDTIALRLVNLTFIHVGVIAHEMIADHWLIPLMLISDTVPYGALRLQHASTSAFEAFMKSCIAGQPLHRDDLGDEDGGTVIGGLNRAVLDFAPHLARQRSLEAAHNFKPAGPSAPGMGMGGSGQQGGGFYIPPKDSDDN